MSNPLFLHKMFSWRFCRSFVSVLHLPDEIALCFPLFERGSGPEIRDLVNTHFPNSHRRIFVWQDLQTDVTMSADVLIHFIQDVVKAVG